MKYINGFQDFLNESILDRSIFWPDDWQTLPEWKKLESIGFYDATNKVMKSHGGILIKNDRLPLYPKGIVLHRAGYIRDKQNMGTHIKRYAKKRNPKTGLFRENSFDLREMLDHVYWIYKNISANRETHELKKELSLETLTLLASQRNTKWSLNKDTNLIDVKGNIKLDRKLRGVTIPNDLRFGTVTGSFDCSQNGLENLDIAPLIVGKVFDCSENNLTSLKNSPFRVGELFRCSKNKLLNLDGIPEELDKLSCEDNRIIDINYKIKVNTIWCDQNPLSGDAISSLLYGGMTREMYAKRLAKGMVDIDFSRFTQEEFETIIGWTDI